MEILSGRLSPPAFDCQHNTQLSSNVSTRGKDKSE
jgi:hypothetical protein